MQYIIGSVKKFDLPSNNIFIDEAIYGDKSYRKIKGHPYFKAINGHALRCQAFLKFNTNSFSRVPKDKLKSKMIKRLEGDLLHTYVVNNLCNQYPQLAFFLSLDYFKRKQVGTQEDIDTLNSLQNLFIFSKEMSKEDITHLRSLGAEDFYHLNQEDMQQVVAFSLRNLYTQMTAESDIDNKEELIDVLSLKFQIKRPILRAIFNNELFPQEEIKSTVKDGKSFNQAEIDYLQNIFFAEVIKNEVSLQDYVDNKNDCYNHLNNLLIDQTLMIYDKEIVLEQIAKYITKNEEK